MRRLTLIVLALAVAAPTARAAQVLSVTSNEEQVTLSYEGGKKWVLNDPICAFRDNKPVACGFVGRLTQNEVIMQVQTRTGRLSVGQTVDLRREVRYPSSVNESDYTAAKKRDIIDISLGVTAGFNYFYPELGLQVAVSRAVTIGASGMYSFTSATSTATTEITAYGIFGDINWYLTHFPFRGVFIQGAFGMYGIQLKGTPGTVNISPLAGQVTVNWRGKPHWGLGIDIGVAAGLMYVQSADVTPFAAADDKFSGILPVFKLYLGYAF